MRARKPPPCAAPWKRGCGGRTREPVLLYGGANAIVIVGLMLLLSPRAVRFLLILQQLLQQRQLRLRVRLG